MSDASSSMQIDMSAADRYNNDARFRAIAQSIVSRVLHAHGPINPEEADREAYDIAIRVAALLLETVFQNDAMLKAMREERDAFQKMAEDALCMSPMPISMRKPSPPKAECGAG